MKTMPTNLTRNRCKGSGLLTVLVVVLVIAIATASIASLTTGLPVIIRRQSDAIRAKAIAEAGLNEAYSRLTADFGLRYNPAAFPLTNFGGGSYDITVTPIGDSMARLLSVGRYGVATMRVGMDVRNAGTRPENDGDDDVPPNPWRYAMFANGNLRLNGTPPTVRGHLHTNQEFRLSGNPRNIEGTVTARSFDWSGGQLPPQQIGTFREVPFPSLSDPYFVSLLGIAQANNAVRPGGRTYRASDFAGISGGVIWITGNATLHGSFTFNGVVVVTGKITFQGSGTRVINGLLYTPSSIEANGSTELYLTGSLMAGGNIEFNGASSIFTHGAVGPGGDEDDTPTGEDRIVVTAWWEG